MEQGGFQWRPRFSVDGDLTNQREGVCAAPHLFSCKLLVSGGFAVNLGFEGLLTTNINLDLLGLGFGLLGKANLQHTPVVVGAYLPWIDRTGQCERAGE